MKILDFQGLTLGHPAQDIWTIVYASTDPDYRAASLEADLRAYYAVLATYMEAAPAFEEFMQEVEERWVYGMVFFNELIHSFGWFLPYFSIFPPLFPVLQPFICHFCPLAGQLGRKAWYSSLAEHMAPPWQEEILAGRD